MSTDEPRPPLVVALSGAELEPSLVGAKAAQLDRVIALGFDVPRSFAITTEAYRRFIEHAALDSFVDELRRQTTSGDKPDISDEEVDAVFASAELPLDISEAIARCTRDLDAVPGWAVRSSATAEDLEGASFAGQYSSLLDVAPEGVEDAVKQVWASLWHHAPRMYRWFHGIDDTGLAMGVLVMEMLGPSHAGVIFTMDPLSPPGVARIEIVEGLGESLVSGAVTPEVVLADRSLHASAGDPYPFTPAILEAGLTIERAQGVPQDVEWAVADGQLFILQARPITTPVGNDDSTDDGFDTCEVSGATVTAAGINEMLPGHLGPRLWSLNRHLVESGFRQLFSGLGADAPEMADPDVHLVARCRGRAVLHLDAMKAAAGSIPGGSADELERQYLGERGQSSSPPTSQGRAPLAALRQGTRTLRARSAAGLESEIVVQIVERLLDQEPDLGALDDEALFALRSRLVHVAGRVTAAEISIAAMATASYQSVEQFLGRHLADGAEVSRLAQTLTAGAGTSRSGSLERATGELCERLGSEPPLAEANQLQDWDAAERVLLESSEGRSFLDDLRRSLRHAGSMAVFGGLTWDETPELAWLLLVGGNSATSAAPDDPDRVRQDVERRLAEDPVWRYTRAVRGQIIDARKHFLRRESAEAAAFLDRREQTKGALLRLGGIVRRVDLEIGKRLRAAGRLETEDDIDLLTTNEPKLLLGGKGPSPAALATRRRRALLAARAGPLPRVFVGSPDLEDPPPLAGDRVLGWAASPGRFEGRARVVIDPKTERVERGEILVASSTDASWAPLFLLAGAIVVEEGGPLSHAAIVARELGVPAVVNVPGIVDRVASSSTPTDIAVDGTTGELVLHASAARTGPTAPRVAGVLPARQPPAIIKAGAGLNVFVSGLIGAGALMSMLFAATETVGGKRAQRRFDRRAQPLAEMTVAGVLNGFEAVARSSSGLRRRWDYAWAAAALSLISSFLLAESTESYYEAAPGQLTTMIWAVMLVGGLQLAMLAALAAVAAWRWPRVPLIVRRAVPVRQEHPRTTHHRTDMAALATASLIAGFVVLLTVNLWAPSSLQQLDEWLHATIEATPENDRIGPNWLASFGRPIVVIPMALAIGAGSLRCRILALLFPLLIAGAGIVNVMLWWIVGKERPLMGIHAGRADSFPGGHAITVTLLFGMLPLAAYVVTNRRWVMHVIRPPATLIAIILLIDQVRQGGHWTSDHLAGLLLGLAGVVAVHGLVGSETAHYRCRTCPWTSHRAFGRAQ